MSKIQDALKRASDERQAHRDIAPRIHEADPTAQRLWQEVRRVEDSLAAWSARQTPAAVTAVRPVHGAAAPAQPARPGSDWRERLVQCERQIAAFDEQLVGHLEVQASLEAQTVTQERAAAQAAAALNTLRRQLDEARTAAEHVEHDKRAAQRTADALRECQKLAEASSAATQELQATEEMIARALDYQQKVADKLAQYRQHRDTAQRAVEGLQRQLQQALARVDGHGTQPESIA